MREFENRNGDFLRKKSRFIQIFYTFAAKMKTRRFVQ